eukprot:COSAG06_NODE_11482_length_1503_cov_7.179487_1_plen_231_part_00
MRALDLVPVLVIQPRCTHHDAQLTQHRDRVCQIGEHVYIAIYHNTPVRSAQPTRPAHLHARLYLLCHPPAEVALDGWCRMCAQEREDPPAEPASRKRGREAAVAKQRERRRERAVAGRPLETHIGPRGDLEGGTERGAHERLAQLPWCGSGLYRCARCYPLDKVGQTRAVPAKACTDPWAHMPRGYADRECVHYLPTGAAASELPTDTLEQLRVLAREHGCEQCRAAANQ